MEEAELYGDVSDKYNFQKDNPFANENKPLETSMRMIQDGRANDAILALEAHLQKHPDDVNSWRILGRLHQENDQDRIAISCLLNAHKIDPQNLDNLLALGVSCTNILDEVQAMNHLKNWMLNNKNYQMINIDPNVIPNDGVGDMWNIDDIKAMNAKLLGSFQKARELNPTDPDLLTSLAVLHFIARDYYNSVSLFDEALKYNADNYALWNKLGATLAHLGRTEEAINAYHRALELKPNFVRVWVNLGIAHAFKGDYEEGVRFYLNALSLNPKAVHVWNYLQTAFVCLERYDLVAKVKSMNVNEFRDEFDIIKVEDLPKPETEYKTQTEKFLLKDNVEKWLSDYQGEQQ